MPDSPQSHERPGVAGEGAAPPALRIGVSMRTLFDLEADHAVFESQGVDAYVRSQRMLEARRLDKGPGYDAISRLLGLNEPGRPASVEVVLVSRNAPDMSLRAFASIEDHGLAIATGSFTNGASVAPFLAAWGIDLFLSNEAADVEAATGVGVAAAKFSRRLDGRQRKEAGRELRIAFDGDAVLFDDESERIFESEGLEAFLRHEVDNAATPMAPGPFGRVFRKLAALSAGLDGERRIRTALVTARSAPAHARAVNTLRAWGTDVDEAHFVGDGDKAPILAAFGAHLFFDDRRRHVEAAASALVASGLQFGQHDRLMSRPLAPVSPISAQSV